MNEINQYNPQLAREDFAKSANWQAFQIEFAKNFYALKPEHADYPAFFDLAMRSSAQMPLLIQAINELEETGKKKITAKQLSRKYFEIKQNEYEYELQTTDCSICNNTRIVHNCEATINGTLTLLDPNNPQPCTAYATTAPCRCVGGDLVHTEKRFLPPRDEETNQLLIGCEHISQRIFIADCTNLNKRTNYTGGAGRPA